MLTPLGAIYSTNITPDKETGIGLYSFDDFNNATKNGVRKDNSALYPAMPYPSYQIMPDEDVAAMYAFFMSGVKPVKQANRKSELPPILNWRWPLALNPANPLSLLLKKISPRKNYSMVFMIRAVLFYMWNTA